MENRTKLQAVRRELGYPAATVLRLLAERARAHNIGIMTPASLKTKLSRWENGHEAVGLPEYRRLFREIYGRTDAELGFPDDDGTRAPPTSYAPASPPHDRSTRRPSPRSVR